MLTFKVFLKEISFDDILIKQRNVEGVHPALRDPITQKVYSNGDKHADIFKNMPPEAQENFKPYITNNNFEETSHAGFVNHKGEWLSRYKLSKQLGNLNGGKASAESLLKYFHENIKDLKNGK